ncbi:MAG: hypothetical protein WAN10_13120 [Candidatus Acidiferrales bacterium]
MGSDQWSEKSDYAPFVTTRCRGTGLRGPVEGTLAQCIAGAKGGANGRAKGLLVAQGTLALAVLVGHAEILQERL